MALALKALDEVMDTDMKQRVLTEVQRHSDLQNDTLYFAWQKLKKKVQPAIQDITNTQAQPSKTAYTVTMTR